MWKSCFPQGKCQTPTPQAAERLFQPVIVLFLWLVESALISSTGWAYANSFEGGILSPLFVAWPSHAFRYFHPGAEAEVFLAACCLDMPA